MQIANSSYNLLIMSKIVVIGDIHGRAIWRKIIDENPDADKFIILGDYFDSHEKKYYPSRQAFNFKDILKKQKEVKNAFITDNLKEVQFYEIAPNISRSAKQLQDGDIFYLNDNFYVLAKLIFPNLLTVISFVIHRI